MSSSRRLSIAIVAIAIFVVPKPARGQDVAGTWTTEVPVRIAATAGGGEHVEQTALVTVTLTQHGDSVHGTWQMEALADRPAPQPRNLQGVLRDGQVILVDTMEAQVRRGQELPMTVTMVSTMQLRLEGETLTGTQSAESTDGGITSSPRPLVLTRAELSLNRLEGRG